MLAGIVDPHIPSLRSRRSAVCGFEVACPNRACQTVVHTIDGIKQLILIAPGASITLEFRNECEVSAALQTLGY